MNAKRILFAGAGASQPLGLQPTSSFLELLGPELVRLIKTEEHISPNRDYEWSKQFGDFFQQAAKHYGVAVPDSEYLLDYIEYLSKACANLAEAPEVFRSLAETGGASGYHEQWHKMLKRFRKHIETVVVSHYASVDGQKALNLYRPCFESISQLDDSVTPVFTTNYDWAFESFAGEESQGWEFEDGFKMDSHGARWNPSAFKSFQPRPGMKNLVLFKLHGSTSWYRDENSPMEIRKMPTATTKIGDMSAVVIYPTQVKEEAVVGEPFKTAYEYLRSSLQNTHLCVVIGFTFRDPAINEVFRNGFSSNQMLKLVLVDPGLKDKQGSLFKRIPEILQVSEQTWGERIEVIDGKFGEEGVYKRMEEAIAKCSSGG